MKSIFAKANKSLSIGLAASLLPGSYFASPILGLLRDRLLAAKFGIDSGVLDSYWAAFSIPDMMYFFLVTGALSVTFIPVFIDRLQKGNKKSAWEISNSVINLMAIATFIGSILVFIFADPLVYLTNPGFNQPRHELAVSLMRVIAINPFIFSISTVIGSMQQALGRFFFYSIAPLFYNLGIIIGIVFLTPKFGILGAAFGVTIGSLLQLTINLIGLIGVGFEYQPVIYWKNKGFRQVLKLLVPRSLDQGMDQVNAMVERFLASFLAYGSIASYQYAFNLVGQPIILIGVAISTAAFPSITARAASTRSDLFGKEVMSVIGSIIWFAVPASVIAFLMRGYLVRLYLGQGNAKISDALGFFVLAIIGRALFHVLTRAYYAQQDTKTPLNVSFLAVGLNIVLAFILVNVFFSISGLALAQSITAVFESSILFYILHKRYGNFLTKRFLVAVAKILLAGFVMAIINYVMVKYVFPLRIKDVGFFSIMPRFVAILSVSGLSYIIMTYILKLKESVIINNLLQKHIFRPLKLRRMWTGE